MIHVVHGCKGPQGVGRRESLRARILISKEDYASKKFSRNCRSRVLGTATLAAQVKELPKTPVRPLNTKIVDINTAA